MNLPRPVKILFLVAAFLVAIYLGSRLFLGSAGLDLEEIATRLEMDCSPLTIDSERELLGINLSQIIEDQTFTCNRNGVVYEVASRDDFERLTAALIPRMPVATGLDPTKLAEDCQSLAYSISVDNAIAEHLVLTTSYAFVSYSGLAGLKPAMEAEGVDIKSNPSACDEFGSWYQG